MDILMDREKLKALAKELAKDIKTEADLNMLSRELVKAHCRNRLKCRTH